MLARQRPVRDRLGLTLRRDALRSHENADR